MLLQSKWGKVKRKKEKKQIPINIKLVNSTIFKEFIFHLKCIHILVLFYVFSYIEKKKVK